MSCNRYSGFYCPQPNRDILHVCTYMYSTYVASVMRTIYHLYVSEFLFVCLLGVVLVRNIYFRGRTTLTFQMDASLRKRENMIWNNIRPYIPLWNIPSNLWYCACRRCSNYIFILDLTPDFNWLYTDSCKTRRESYKFWCLVCLVLQFWRYACLYSAVLRIYYPSGILWSIHPCSSGLLQWHWVDCAKRNIILVVFHIQHLTGRR